MVEKAVSFIDSDGVCGHWVEISPGEVRRFVDLGKDFTFQKDPWDDFAAQTEFDNNGWSTLLNKADEKIQNENLTQ